LPNTQRRARGSLSAPDLDREVAEFWQELRVQDDLRSRAAELDIDVDSLLALTPDQAITITPDSAGLDPASIALIVAFAPTANHVIKSAWDNIIVPWIRKRRGKDAIGDIKPDKKAQESNGD